jgi:beta-lactamase regulating signal transducer with metallopeptidase domain
VWIQPWIQNLAERAADNSTNTKVVAHRQPPRQAHDDGVAARSEIVLRESNHDVPLETFATIAAEDAPLIVDEMAAQSLVDVNPASASAGPIATQTTHNPGGVDTVAVEPVRTGSETPFQLIIQATLVLWAAGSLFMLLRHAIRFTRLRRIIRGSSPAPKWLVGEVAVQSCKYRLRPPRVGVCAGLPCPVVVALPRATLLWPSDLEHRLDDGARHAVLAHELAHLKRLDHLAAWLEVAVACLWWWHPVVWWARRELREYSELACDAWVVAQLPSERSRYARALVDVCEFISLAKTPAAPAVGMALGARRCFERRLHMILRQRIAARTPLVVWLTIFAAALLVLPGFSTGQDGPTADEPATASTKDSSTSSVSKPGVESIEDPATGPQATVTTKGQPIDPAADPRIGGSDADVAADPQPRSTTNTTNPPGRFPANSPASAAATTPEELRRELSAIQTELSALRGKGKLVEKSTIDRVGRALSALVDEWRPHRVTDEHVAKEVFAWVLGRLPNQTETQSWSEFFRRGGSVEHAVRTLLQSSHFTGTADPADDDSIPYRFKQAKVQSLLRVTYDMPAEKAAALAKFLGDHVSDGVDIRLVEKAGDEGSLVVTAHANVQKTVASVVSLMTGEPVSINLAGETPVGHATVRVPMYSESPPPYDVPTTTYAPSPIARPALDGVYPPPPAQYKSSLRARTILEPGWKEPRTIYENVIEEVPSKDPTSRKSVTTKELPPATDSAPTKAPRSDAQPQR